MENYLSEKGKALFEHLRVDHALTRDQEKKMFEDASHEGLPSWDRNGVLDGYLQEYLANAMSLLHKSVHLADTRKYGVAWYFKHAREVAEEYTLKRVYSDAAFRGGWE